MKRLRKILSMLLDDLFNADAEQCLRHGATNHDLSNDSAAVNEKRGWQRIYLIRSRYVPFFVQQDWETKAVLRHKGSNGSGLVLVGAVDSQHDESLLFILLVQLFNGRHLRAAWRTPGCPYVDQDRLSAQGRECIRFTFRCLQ